MKKNHIAFTGIIGFFVVVIIVLIMQPCAKLAFALDPETGKVEFSWEKLPALYCLQGTSEVSDEKINEVKKLKTEYEITKDITELKEAEKAKLLDETKVLEPLSEKDPSLVPLLENRREDIEEINQELDQLSEKITVFEEQYQRSLGNLDIVAYSDEEKDKQISKIQSLLGATIELDQKTYTWTDRMYITVVAPGANKDPNLKDIIGNDEVVIETGSGQRLEYSLVEEKPNSGIFVGEITLTGFPFYDANNDGRDDDATGKTYGSGPFDGQIGVNSDDGITVTYEFDKDQYVIGSAIIRWNIGEISFLDYKYQLNDIATIRVIDPDLNTNPDKMDLVKVNVSSTTKPDGIDINLLETGNATGIFEGFLKFTTEQKSSMNTLKASLGNEITARYVDKTLPHPYSVGDTLEMESTALIEETLKP